MTDFKQFEFNDRKFRELVIYIAEKCADDPTFGATKLNKILYYSDFYAYRVIGEPITGASYQKLSAGPAPREFLPQKKILEDTSRATFVSQPYFNGVQTRIVPAEGEKPDLSIFQESELALVDEVIHFFRGKSAADVSAFSHREPGWIVCNISEVIPYETAWIGMAIMDAETEVRILEGLLQ